jgi:hypothetical protein
LVALVIAARHRCSSSLLVIAARHRWIAIRASG